MLADLVFVKGKTFLHDHICPYRLSAERIGMAYDSAFADAFHFIDAVFHFAGINIFTVHDDQVFDAVYNVNVSISVHVYQVAGTEPAVFIEYFLCFFRFFPVTFHHVVPADGEFADCARNVRSFLISDDFYLYTGEGGTGSKVFRLSRGEDGNDGRRFCQAVTFLHRMAEPFIERLRHRLG